MRIFLLILVWLMLAAEALAQEPSVPAELLKPRRRLQGNQITFCLSSTSIVADLDRAVGTAIAKSLLLEPRFVEVQYTGFALLDDGDFFSNLFIDLTNNCDAFMGLNLDPGYPDWLTFSRPYARLPYILAVTKAEYQKLGDIPRGKTLGLPLSTGIDAHFGAYARNLPESQSWQRLPYGTQGAMLEQLLNGTLEGAFFWAPSLQNLLKDKPADAARVRAVSLDPLTLIETQLVVAMRARDTLLRTTVDKAILSIIRDGSIARILKEQNLAGAPGALDASELGPLRNPVFLGIGAGVIVLGILGAMVAVRSRRPRR